MIRFLIVMGCFVLLGRCRQPEKDMAFQSIHIRQLTDRMTDIMVHDVTNPPLAARFFAYTCLAGYEVAVQHDPALKSMQHMLRGYPAMEKPDLSKRNRLSLVWWAGKGNHVFFVFDHNAMDYACCSKHTWDINSAC